MDRFLRNYALLLLFAGALSVAACQKESSRAEQQGQIQEEELIIQAITEEANWDVSKTIRVETTDGKPRIDWLPGDAISLFYGSGTGGGSKFVALTEEQAHITNFSGTIGVVTGGGDDVPEDQTFFWGLYPYDPTAECDGNTITVTIPDIQPGLPETFGPGMAPSLGHARGLMLAFKNVWSGYGFTVSEDGYNELTFRGNRGEVLAGRARVGIDADGNPSVSSIISGITEVTIKAPAGEFFIPGKYYYMQFYPCMFEEGFTVELSSLTKVGTYVYSSSRNFARNSWGRNKNVDTRCTTFVDRTVTRADFADEVFANYIFDNFDTDHDGKLSLAERDAVENINVRTNVITSVQGIEYFPNLLYLQCYGNIWNNETHQNEKGLLTSLNVSYNSKLRELYCQGNQLTSLDVSKNTKLQHLNCSQNQLTVLDLSQNPELVYLMFESNSLTTIDLSHNPSLKTLNCNYNQLTSMDVSGYPELENFYCHGNPLESFDISVNTALRELSCGGLSLTSLDVSHLPKLESLDCWGNPLGSLDIRNNPKLRYLYCYSCGLTSLDVTENPLLQDFDCENNQLTSLDVSGCPVLNYLYAVNNPMTTLYIYEGQTIRNKYLPEGVTEVVKAVQGMAIDETTFPDANFRAYVSENFDTNKDGQLTNAELLSVTSIYINTDNVASMDGIQYFKNLVRLECRGSSYNWETRTSSGLLTSIDISQLNSLERLYLGNNRLTALDVSHNTELSYLECYNNRLTALDVSHNTELSTLYCYRNQIVSLDISSNTKLSRLNCGDNLISSLDVANNSQLVYLSCTGSLLSTLDVSNNKQLQQFYCSGNQISSLDVSNNTELRNIDFGLNKISTLDFSHNSKLETISVYDTQIQSLDLSALTQLTYVDVSYCSVLETVRLPETLQEISDGTFQACYLLKEVNMPLSLTRIGDRAFQNCYALTQVTIPVGVTYIGSYAFRYCSRLTRIAVLPLTPPEGSVGMFLDTNECPIGIQTSALAAYQSAAYWSDYAARFATFGSGDNEGVGYNEW